MFSLACILLQCACVTQPAVTPVLIQTPPAELPTTPPAGSPTPSIFPGVTSTPALIPGPSVTPTPQVDLFNRYLGKDTRRQPELIKTPPANIIPIQKAEGYSQSYIAIFLGGKQVNGSDILGNASMFSQLIRLFNDAFKAGHTSQTILSSYRSYDEQVYLKSQNNSEEDEAVAEPGRSEHQLGTAVDLAWNAERLNFYLMTVYPKARDFYTWLKDNAQRYGFVFSYPYKSTPDQSKNNILTGYITEYKAEPWHLRFVGAELALRIYSAKDPQGRNYLDPTSNLIPQQFLLPQ